MNECALVGCRWLVENKGFNKDEPNKVLDFFIFGVTIIVVAVPEGLPLAVTISLAYRCASWNHAQQALFLDGECCMSLCCRFPSSKRLCSAFFLYARSQGWEVA